jgi:signal transduction histidine kinase/phage shock protein PspC (stress-responsive transcriptional regulator)
MTLIPPGGRAGHHGGISDPLRSLSDPDPVPDPGLGRPPWQAGRRGHASRWQPPEWSGGGDSPGWDRDWVRGRIRGRIRHDHRHVDLRHLRDLRRRKDSRVVAGVCSGISRATGIDVMIVRGAFVLFSVFSSGVAVLAYAVAWLMVPVEGESSTIFSRAIRDRRGLRLIVALVPVIVALQIVISILHIGFLGLLSLPMFLAAGVGILIWRNANEAEKAWIHDNVLPMLGAGRRGQGRWLALVRVAAGVSLAVGGVLIVVLGHASVAVLRPVGGALLIIAAFVVVFGPWWLSLARDLMSERQARALAEERAQMAAHVHDSVLQTLALIQRSPDDPQHVVRLARAQERELRAWLFEGRPPGSIGEDATMLGEGVGLLQRQVEADHGIAVQVVLVGDCELTDPLRALLDAAREATVNAAKWSGAEQVSLYAEVEEDHVMLFVRDRGRGFDPAAVPGDRQGIARSIRDRMSRHGGSVAIRSAPGQGAEVELSMPRRELVK